MSRPTRTFWLSMHLPYACRHSGACCSAGWPIPIERSRVDQVASLRADRAWLVELSGAPPGVAGVLAMSNGGRCVFHHGRCEIQHTFGHNALPSACQHFPRRVRLDPRGVFVTLSHYCPTAADLLFTHRGPVTIVDGPPAIPHGEAEGLDARDVLPPLLAASGPGLASTRARTREAAESVLMDWEAYSAWETHMVDVLANRGLDPEDALRQLERELAALQQWRPGGESLADRVAQLADRKPGIGAAPDDREPAPHVVIGRYLAARAFASWCAFGEHGVVSVLAQLRTALTAVSGKNNRRPARRVGDTLIGRRRASPSLRATIRQADLHLMHCG